MPHDAVKYRGEWIAPGSTAFQLYQDKKFQELDKHLKALGEAERKLRSK